MFPVREHFCRPAVLFVNSWPLQTDLGQGEPMIRSLDTHRFLVLMLAILLIVTVAGGCARRNTVSLLNDGTTSSGKVPAKSLGTAGTESMTPTASDQQTVTDRKIIFNASLALDVTEAEKAFKSCETIVAGYNGFVAQSSLQKSDTQILATVTLRVPAARVTQLMDSLVKLGTVTSRSSGSQDVTSQYIDLQARLKVLRAEEVQLVQFLKKATTIKDMLAVQEQLRSVRTQIEQYEGQQRYLDNAASLATVTVQLVQTTEAFVTPRGFGSAFVQSLARFGHGLAAFWTWLGGSVVFIIFYGLLLGAVLWILVRLLRHRLHKTSEKSTLQ